MSYLILAVRFLTIVPVPGREAGEAGALGRAAWWFPPVGLALGACLVVADRLLLLAFPSLLAATLLVAVWKIATGGLHLDGLADAIDGLGGGSPPRRLAIMRDHQLGVFGAIALGLTLLISVAAVDAVPASRRPAVLLLAPAVGRLAPVLIGPLFPAATPGQGSGADFLAGLSPWTTPVQVTGLWILAVLMLGPWGGLLLSVALGLALLWAAFLAPRLGGLTGDVLGASVEIGELATLTGAVALIRTQLI
jgi:adenosylcobinamide-GDP ribazoletransferase